MKPIKNGMKDNSNKPTHWFFLRGLVRESGHWGSFVETFQSMIPHSTVQCLDLPGAGEHFQVEAPFHMSAYADFVRQHAQFPKDGRNCYILAISLGAMVAQEWLKDKPTGLHGAVFINTSLNLLSPFWERLQPHNYPTLLQIAMTSNLEIREREILRMTTQHADIEKLLPRWVEIARTRPVNLRNAAAQLMAAATYTGVVDPPPRPALILRSLGDQLVNPRASEKIAKSWSAPLSTHPSAGHDLPLDDGPWVCEQILRFLQSSP